MLEACSIDDIAKQYGDVVAALQGADLSVLQSLPSRLSAIEEKTPGLHDAKDEDHSSFETTVHNSADMNKSAGLSMDQSNLPVGEKLETLQADFDDQNNRISRLEEQIKELKTTMQDAAKAYSSDIESLQKICRNLRSDLEMLPILDISASRESVQGPVSVNPDYGGALSEIQTRLQRKADNDTVAQLIRTTAQAKEGLEKLKLVVDELKQQVRSTKIPASRRSSSTIIQAPPQEASMTESFSQKDLEVDPKVISEIIVEEKVRPLRIFAVFLFSNEEVWPFQMSFAMNLGMFFLEQGLLKDQAEHYCLMSTIASISPIAIYWIV
ncbi:hypothetical protein L7F22_052404 [Adiantum nelumboides]|nr:hypothetical protein [Adiantum nelumboides]